MRNVLALGAACCIAGCFSPSDRALMGDVVDAGDASDGGDDGRSDAAMKDAAGYDADGLTDACSPSGSACTSDTDCCSMHCHETRHCE